MHIVYGPYPVKKRFKQNHKSMSTFVEGPIFECEISGQLLVWLLIFFGRLDLAFRCCGVMDKKKWQQLSVKIGESLMEN